MNYFDIIRFLAIAAFGIGIGFMVLVNIVSFKVLRPPHRMGFLWWHVTSISLSFLCIGVVATERIASKIGDPPSWRGPLTLVGMTLYAVAQIIIYRVERQRLVDMRARKVALRASPPGTYSET